MSGIDPENELILSIASEERKLNEMTNLFHLMKSFNQCRLKFEPFDLEHMISTIDYTKQRLRIMKKSLNILQSQSELFDTDELIAEMKKHA